MKLLLPLTVFLIAPLLIVTYSCKKEATTEYDRIVGEWSWTISTGFTANGTRIISYPLAGGDSAQMIFNKDLSFTRNNWPPVFHIPLPLAGAYEIKSPTGDFRRTLTLTGQDFQGTVDIIIEENKMIFLERLSPNELYQHEFKKK